MQWFSRSCAWEVEIVMQIISETRDRLINPRIMIGQLIG